MQCAIVVFVLNLIKPKAAVLEIIKINKETGGAEKNYSRLLSPQRSRMVQLQITE